MSIRLLALAAVLLSACTTPLHGTAMADHNSQGIHVNGVGEVRIEPDMLRVNLDITQQAATVAKARKETDRVTSGVLALARKLGVESRDVLAASIRVHPIYSRSSSSTQSGPPKIEGFQANRSITVTLRDLDDLDGLLSGAVDAGINGIGNIALDTSKRVELEQQALDLAIADARGQAAHVAKQFDVSLGGVINVHVSGHSPAPQMMERGMVRMAMSDESVPFAGGELSITRNVSALFGIGLPN